MRQLIILGVAVIGTLGIGIGNTEAAPSVLSDGLTTSSLPTILPTIDVRYYRRYPPPYYYRGRHSYVSPHCYNKDEIRELQRMWPETNWPRSMRCFPYR
jgi:hypothetical protein